jgi:hypothetical protein
MVLGALHLTIRAANGVSVYLKQVLLILSKLCALSKRLLEYRKIEISEGLRGILFKQLSIVLRICAISTRQMQDNSTKGRTKLWAKSVLGQRSDEVPELLDALEQGIDNEHLQNSAETLVTVTQSASRHDQAFERGQRQIEELSQKVTDLLQLHKKKETAAFQELFKFKGADAIKAQAISLLDPSDLAENEFKRYGEKFDEGGRLGNWISQDAMYQDFKAGRHSKLLVTGLPGSGKSCLAYNAIRDLQQDETAYVGYFFFSRDADKIVTPEKALCTIASHIAKNSQAYSRLVLKNCQRRTDLGRLDTAWKLLFADKFIDTGESLKRTVYLVIDAPGALSKPDRALLCNKLQQVGSRSSGLRVVVFGRPEIHEELGKEIATIHVGHAKNGNDIAQYVRTKLESLKNLNRLPSETQECIVKAISTKADGIFLWADLALADVVRQDASSLSKVETVLDKVPSGLVDALSHSLEQTAANLSPEKLSELNCLLAWVAWTKLEIPLTLDLLNAFLRLDDTHDGDIRSLRDTLIRYSTIFKLDILDDAWVADHDHHGTSSPTLQRMKSEQSRLEDEICNTDPKSVSVNFFHTSVKEYIRGDPRLPIRTATTGSSRNPIRSAFWAQQKIASSLMKLLRKGSLAEAREVKVYAEQVKVYAERWWPHHLVKGIPPDSAANLEVEEIPEQLYDMLNNEQIWPLWTQHIAHNDLDYTTARAFEQILTGEGATLFFNRQSKDTQKWRKSIKDHPLLVFDEAMSYCGRTWLKKSPPHVLNDYYSIAAIQYYKASKASPADERSWCVCPKAPRYSIGLIQDAAHYYTGKHKDLWKCRLAIAYEMGQGNGAYHAEQALRKIRDKDVRWEADLALAKLYAKKSQWDNAIGSAQSSLNGLVDISSGQSYYKFAFECNKLIAECSKQKLKTLQVDDPGYNQRAMMVAECLRRAVRLRYMDSILLDEAICAFHSVALRLMLDGTAFDAEDFMEDDFSASDSDVGSSTDTERTSSNRRSVLAPASRSDLNITKERPSSDKRTLSGSSVSSPKATTEHRHRLSRASIGNANFFRTTRHGSDTAHDSIQDSWEDGTDSIDELRAISSPRLYFDNYDVS